MSRRFLKDAHYSIHKLFKDVEGLSFKSRHDYADNARLFITQLHEAGYQLSRIHHIKQRHVKYLVARWQEEHLNPATIKNRVSQLRFIARAIRNPLVVPPNTEMGLAPRQYLSENNKAIRDIDFARFSDSLIRHSVRLQQLFGLRREESLKFIVTEADKGSKLVLKGSWTKGGIPRAIPITTEAQRAFLDELKQILPKGASLIPPEKSYREQEIIYIGQVRLSGYRNLHGLRHAYAQERYRTLTANLSNTEGWECPRNGGMPANAMNEQQKQIDFVVRRMVSEELGHSRVAIVKIYCG
ncbi:MAG: integrase [Legionellales bacterium]|nr:integrase [Legionellales bacterium]